MVSRIVGEQNPLLAGSPGQNGGPSVANIFVRRLPTALHVL